MQHNSVLILDDDPLVARTIARFLGMRDIPSQTSNDPIEAIEMIKAGSFRTAIIDIKLPKMNGIHVASKMKTLQPKLNIVLMTAYMQVDYTLDAIKLGVKDFLQKPIDLQQLETTLIRLSGKGDKESKRDKKKRRKNLFSHLGTPPVLKKKPGDSVVYSNLQEITLRAWASLVEYGDEDTGAHLNRIAEYTECLMLEIARHENFASYLTTDYIHDVKIVSMLHDVGKIGVPDSILLKPGKLTTEEFDVMKKHVTIGGRFLEKCKEEWNALHPDIKSTFELASQIAYCHHEKWDGSGYGRGMKGDDIPLSARIVAISDVYDALTSKRPYKDAMPHEKAVEIIIKGSGSHFDPFVVNSFMNTLSSFETIQKKYA